MDLADLEALHIAGSVPWEGLVTDGTEVDPVFTRGVTAIRASAKVWIVVSILSVIPLAYGRGHWRPG
jgi:hypothetical protein